MGFVACLAAAMPPGIHRDRGTHDLHLAGYSLHHPWNCLTNRLQDARSRSSCRPLHPASSRWVKHEMRRETARASAACKASTGMQQLRLSSRTPTPSTISASHHQDIFSRGPTPEDAYSQVDHHGPALVALLALSCQVDRKPPRGASARGRSLVSGPGQGISCWCSVCSNSIPGNYIRHYNQNHSMRTITC